MSAITVKGRVTIPKAGRDALGIGTGSKVDFVANRDGEFVIRKAEPEPQPHPFHRLRGILGPGTSTDEVMALTGDEDCIDPG
jgi:AbrB family looped-hinge helix DNA binding protein